MKINYDHVTVVMDAQQALHISPPKIRVLKLNYFLMRNLNPVIIRPRLNPEEQTNFLNKLKTYLNSPYDYKTMIRLVSYHLLDNIVHIHKATKQFSSLRDQ